MIINTSVIIAEGMGTRLEGHGHLRPKGFWKSVKVHY